MPCTTRRVFLSTRMDIKIRNAGRIWKPEIHEEHKRTQRIFLFSYVPDSRFLVSWFPDSLLLSFVNHELVSVGIPELRHPADRCLGLFNIEFHAAIPELRV